MVEFLDLRAVRLAVAIWKPPRFLLVSAVSVPVTPKQRVFISDCNSNLSMRQARRQVMSVTVHSDIVALALAYAILTCNDLP
jgi:hypothetical protein